jgi:hypothetical protein
MFALGGKQSFYKALMPTAYSSDTFVEKRNRDPRLYGGWTNVFDGPACYKPYRRVIDDAFWSYPSINNPTTWDVFIVTQTKTSNYPGTKLTEFASPSQSLLNDMFSAPNFGGTSPQYRLTGGAGLTHDDLMPTRLGGYLNERAGVLYGKDNGNCQANPP